MQSAVLFEHPLNERVRNLLRLEFLFREVQHFGSSGGAWEARSAIGSLVELLTILSRADLKTEFIKELERNIANLNALAENPAVDMTQLSTVLKHLEFLRGGLHQVNGPLGQDLRDDPFLGAIRQRSDIPGGTCSFDLPAFHLWLHQSPERRRDDMQGWLDKLKLTRQTVELLLKLIRGSATPTTQTAEKGSFQQNLDPNAPYQMIRVTLDPSLQLFPEISGGKHRFVIRFMESDFVSEEKQTTRDVPFRLTSCVL